MVPVCPVIPVEDVSVNKTSLLSALQVRFHHGCLIPHQESITYFIQDNINGIEVDVPLELFNNLNNRGYTKDMETGAGYYFSNLGNPDVYGNVHGLFYYLDYPLFRRPARFNVRHKTCMGLSYLTKPFDIEKNYFNRAYGSPGNFFFIFSLDFTYRLTDVVQLYGGPSMVHNSSGNLKMPNFGMNMITGNLGARYLFRPLVRRDFHYSNKDFDKHHIRFTGAGNVRSVTRRSGDIFINTSFITDYVYQYQENRFVGLGFDLFYDPTVNEEKLVENRSDLTYWQTGVHGAYEVLAGNLGVILQSGINFFYPLPKGGGRWFNRLGLRYSLPGKWYVNVSIKAHSYIADYVETGLGYDISF